MRIILSFDVEEHDRIEAAVGLAIPPELKRHYRQRLDLSTRWLLDQLARWEVRATFFVVGQICRHNPGLIRAIARAGHEVASHGWDHRCLLRMTPAKFRADLRQSKDALEQTTGLPVVGFRAPTFSIVRQTAWALDVLAEAGMVYDSSIYPIRHDRYGVPAVPRVPFLAGGGGGQILELPPATYRVLGCNFPVGGGGYFRLLPGFVLARALRQVGRDCWPAVAMLYFHPWEFDPDQERLPLARVSRLRTYLGIRRNRERFLKLVANYRFTRAIDVAKALDQQRPALTCFDVGAGAGDRTPVPRPVVVARPAE